MNSPFDENKLKSLEGLVEYSIVNLSELDKARKRLDAEFYKSHHLELEDKINEIGKIYLKDLNVNLDCSAFYPSITGNYNFNFEGVPFLRVNDIQNGLVSVTSDTAFLPTSVLDENKSTIKIAYPGDIVIAKGGNTLAKLGLVTEEYPSFSLSRDLILIRTNNLDTINKYFLWGFLHSQYGQSLLWRTASQTGQPHLTLSSVEEIGLPRYSNSFENMFEEIYKQSVEYKNKSTKAYQKAEQRVLEVIGFNNIYLNDSNVNLKSFKDAFHNSGRIDAEYFLPKNDDYLNLIYEFPNGYKKLVDVCELKDKNFNPKNDTEYNYIELANVGMIGEIKDCTTAIGSDLPSRARRKVNTNDVIISSIEGSLDSCALILDEYDNAICSTGFYVINSKKINSETLLVLFKSEPMQNILKQNCSGTILTSLGKNDLLNIPVPLVTQETQEEIKLKVNESFHLRKKSEDLLEVLKRAVEIAIEQDEAAAIDYINENT